MSGSRIRPYLRPVIALLVVLALGAGTVYAAIPNGDGKYYACYVTNTGVVKLINYPKVKTCAKGEKLIKWNAQGPAGPAGPQGPKGDPGTSGSSNWGDIKDKPAGFADGVDNVGATGYYSYMYGPGLDLDPDESTWFTVTAPSSVDLEADFIPTVGGDIWVEFRTYERISATEVVHWYFISNGSATDRLIFAARIRIFDQGIAPAALKKIAKSIKVKVVKRHRH